MLDHHVIIDMVPAIAFLYFTGRLAPAVALTGVQQAILLAVGLQRKVLEDVEKELGLPVSQLLAMFVKVVRKVAGHFRGLVAGTVAESLPQAKKDDVDVDVDVDGGMEVQKPRPTAQIQDLDEELREGGEEVDRALKEKQRALVDALPLDRYEIETGSGGRPEEWEDAEKQVQKAVAVVEVGGKREKSKQNKPPNPVTVSVLRSSSSKPSTTAAAAGKRKGGGESAEEVYAAEIGDKEAKRRMRKGRV
ncbi:MAG: hypothetical protein L6R35_006510 [Caloplaca aegaea]|nr:MAG: hypothetical protein L6R35_006510 [Caloplaca aegaea]